MKALLLAFAFGLGVSLGWHRRFWICHMAGAVRYWILCPELADAEIRQTVATFRDINDSISQRYARMRYPEWYQHYIAWRELGYSANPTSQIDGPKPQPRA